MKALVAIAMLAATRAEADPKPACVETTDIHGYRECTKFGAWNANLRIPTILAEFGMNVRRFVNPVGASTKTYKHGTEDFSLQLGGQPGLLDTAVVAQFRIGLQNRWGMFFAIDGDLGGVAGATDRSATTTDGMHGTPDLDRASVSYVGGSFVVGMRNRARRVDMGVEAAGGAYAISYNFLATYQSVEVPTAVSATRGLLEVRARGGYWASPYVMFGVAIGKSLVDEGWMGGVFVSAQSRSFGGR